MLAMLCLKVVIDEGQRARAFAKSVWAAGFFFPDWSWAN